MKDVAELIQQVTPGNWGIIITLVVFAAGWMLKEWRETRKLTTEERQARREGFSAQVDLMMRELAACRSESRALLDDQHTLRREYDDFRRLCHRDAEQHRREIIGLLEEVEGLKRKQAHESQEIAKLKGYEE